jgi:hypothetical protein
MSSRPARLRAPSLIPSTVLALGAAAAGSACDLCSAPSTSSASSGAGLAGGSGSGAFVGVFEQYSDFHTLRDNGERVDNEVDQYMHSSVTQAVAGWRFSDTYAVQAVVPYIHRAFRRPEGFAIDEGVEQGLGDISVIGSMRVLEVGDGAAFLRLDDVGGLKLPTGRSARLEEEQNEVEVPGAPESGVHGHDLALGSGSWDVILGEDLTGRYGRGYLTARLQYVIRTHGDHDYQYANDLTWSVAPGLDVLSAGRERLGLEAVLSGEAKGKDVANGEVAGDTGIVAVYLGPQISGSWHGLVGQLGADFPLLQNNTALQLVPTWRMHGGASWSF